MCVLAGATGVVACQSREAAPAASEAEARSAGAVEAGPRANIEGAARSKAAAPDPQAGSLAPAPLPSVEYPARGAAPGAARADAPFDGSLRASAVANAGIDPNGRFATTYRPGGGHLAAFESAVARGIVPDAERELVSDVGARYVPEVTVPKNQALGFRLDLDRAKLAPSGGTSFLRVTLKSASETKAARPRLSVHLVLDTSGSMRGESIRHARDAASALVDRLEPTDDFSLTTFSDDARVLLPDSVVGKRKMDIKKTIAQIQEGGGTNIAAGLANAYAEARKPIIPSDAIKVVMLVSDGRATMGDVDQANLSAKALAAFQDGIQTSAFGLGVDYDGPLMSALAANGAGGYYYLRDGEQIAPALATELDKRLDPVAQGVEVRVRLPKDVKLLTAYGSRRLNATESAAVRAQEVAVDEQSQKKLGIAKDRENDREGGMRFFIPIFAKGDAHSMLFKLEVPAGVAARSIATVEVKYKDRLAKKNAAFEDAAKIAFANDAAESAASEDKSVLRTVQGFEAGEALAQAAAKVAAGDSAGAIAILTEREGILRQAAKTLAEPLFERDADRLARLRSHAGKPTGLGEPLVLAMLLETASRSHMR